MDLYYYFERNTVVFIFYNKHLTWIHASVILRSRLLIDHGSVHGSVHRSVSPSVLLHLHVVLILLAACQ